MRQAIAVMLAISLAWLPVSAQTAITDKVQPPGSLQEIHEILQKSYLTLFEEAPRYSFDESKLKQMEDFLGDARDVCVNGFEERQKQYDDQLKQAQEELRKTSRDLTGEQRHQRHCQIQNMRILKSQAQTLAEHSIPLAYDNREAKLKLVRQWPSDYANIQRRIETGAYHDREFGNPKDIGFRDVGEGQEEDVERGREAIEQMRQSGLMPPKVENETVQNYVRDLTREIARHSDLRVPVNVEVLNAKEINAFALPGGFLFIQRGLLEEADDEAQLVGVIAHEIAHAAARHGHRLMQRSTISSIIYQAAQVAAMILTGGAAGIGTYYALQYGFYGLGLVLSLDLLGVSRDFEEEADQLGVQYAWHAGYDPTGFIRFFDKMATTKGYVDGSSWFRTHPPFYERMVKTQEEILYLPSKEDPIVESEAFHQMKKELAKVVEQAEEEEQDKPSLKLPEKDCPPPEKIEFESGQPVETICEIPYKS